jgi:hypothetical protein
MPRREKSKNSTRKRNSKEKWQHSACIETLDPSNEVSAQNRTVMWEKNII